MRDITPECNYAQFEILLFMIHILIYMWPTCQLFSSIITLNIPINILFILIQIYFMILLVCQKYRFTVYLMHALNLYYCLFIKKFFYHGEEKKKFFISQIEEKKKLS